MMRMVVDEIEGMVVVVEGKRTVSVVVEVTLALALPLVLYLDIVVGRMGDERLGLGIGVVDGSEDWVCEMRVKNCVHLHLLHQLLIALDLEQGYGGEGLGFVDGDDIEEDGDLFWEDPDSDPYCAFLLPAFN